MLEAVDSAKMVVEAVVENVEVKQNLFAQLDEALPLEVPICSNTSGLRITDISAKCRNSERTVTTHFWLPAHLVPLVEVVMGEKTDWTIAEKVQNELRKWKKSPLLFLVWQALKMWIRQLAVEWQCVFRSGAR